MPKTRHYVSTHAPLPLNVTQVPLKEKESTPRQLLLKTDDTPQVVLPAIFALLVLQLLASPIPTHSSVVLTPSMHSFGNALKAFAFKATHEQLLFNYSSEPEQGNTAPHVITEQWFSLFGSGPTRFNNDARIRIYVDGELIPSLDFQLFFAHTIGVQNCVDNVCSDPRVPWASSEVQHMAHAGALKNRYRIPFKRSIRITATMPSDGVVYYYCRGMTHLPVIVGDLQLPDAARLKLHSNWNISVPPLEQIDLLPPRFNSSGLLYATIWSAQSEFIGFMEGCVRAIPDLQPTIFLSSGTEDYFESANFFNAGQPVDSAPGAIPWPNATFLERRNVFTSAGAVSAPESGVGYLGGTNPSNYSMSAYKFVSRPFPSWNRSILTEIDLCHACSGHEIDDGNGPDSTSRTQLRVQPEHSKAYRFYTIVIHLSNSSTGAQVWWNSFKLTASNYDGGGENPAVGALGCRGAAEGTKPLKQSRPVTMWTYTWTYEW